MNDTIFISQNNRKMMCKCARKANEESLKRCVLKLEETSARWMFAALLELSVCKAVCPRNPWLRHEWSKGSRGGWWWVWGSEGERSKACWIVPLKLAQGWQTTNAIPSSPLRSLSRPDHPCIAKTNHALVYCIPEEIKRFMKTFEIIFSRAKGSYSKSFFFCGFLLIFFYWCVVWSRFFIDAKS